MSSTNSSRIWGVIATLGLTGAGLVFLIAVMEESRFTHDPTPVFVSIAAAAIFFAVWRGPVGKGIGRMLEGQGSQDDQLVQRVEQLEDRLAELGADPLRMAELEDRLDFAERLLAQRNEAHALRRPEDVQ